ncbi:MAG TPA: hypothetical protein VEW05_11155 [Candidatus Polarisedimenticolia bacterium]|nr:hypothetical protein [Candidatus Polarisedimenticolia bacterium]
MNSMTKILGVLVLSVGIMPIPNSAAGNGAEAFEKLKSLVGHWETDKTNMNKATLDLELTSGGTAVLEKFHMVDNGKPVEMTTLYYLDGDQVKLTHYCMAGNQPTMKGSYAPESKTMTFHLVSISNLKTPNDGHMHHAAYTFIDNDHFKTTWTFRKEQKDAFTEDVTYVRTK